MALLYFIKLNISSEIFNIYDGKSKKENILHNIFKSISYTNHKMIVEDVYEDKIQGIKRVRESEYELKIQEKDIQDKIIIGDFTRYLPVFLNQKDEYGNITPRPEDNYEVIRFYLDLTNEIIVFHTTIRFGYRQFQKYFENYINETIYIYKNKGIDKRNLKELDIPKYVILNFITTNYKIDGFRELLIKKGNISEISYSFIFPNGNDDLINGLNDLTDGLIEQYKEAQINHVKKELVSNTDTGLVINSTPIDEFFRDVQKIKYGLDNQKISDEEEQLDPGYIEINAKTKSGEDLSTQDEYIYTIEISNIDRSIHRFRKVAFEAISKIRSMFF